MQIQLALYDPSFIGSDHSYWTWRSDIIPVRLLDECYYRFLIKQKPEKPEQILNHDLFGGIIKLQNWFVVYRFYNGGRDLYDRPGRYVILTGWINADDVHNCTPSEIFSYRVFEALALTTPPCPVPQPDSLVIDVSGVPLKRNSTAIYQFNGKYEFPAGASVASAVEYFFSLVSQSDTYQLTINKADRINHLAIETIPVDTQNARQILDQQDLQYESQFNSDEVVQASHSDILFPREDNMKFQHLSLFNTCALIFIIIFLSVLFIQQISIQKQINRNSEIINSIQQKLNSLHPEQNDFYYNPNPNFQNIVAPDDEHIWTSTQESTETDIPQNLPQRNQSLKPFDPQRPTTAPDSNMNESDSGQSSKNRKTNSWNILRLK